MNLVRTHFEKFWALSRRRKLALIGGVVAVVLVLIPLLTYAYFARDIANEERLMNRNNTGVVLLDRHGDEFFRAYNANVSTDRERVPFDDLPANLVEALIAAEDRNFYDHGGYSVRGTVAALYGNILNRDPTRYGGSTITQQLAKNALLTPDKSYFRKYQELALAIAIERHYEKDKILEMYLNSVYFGEGAFGIENAAQTYFSKPATELTLAESSMLMGLLPSPSSSSPVSGSRERADAGQERVLQAMTEEGYIAEEDKIDAQSQELALSTQEDLQESVFAVHFAEMVLDQLRDEYGEEQIARSGFRVQTTLDSAWQGVAETSIRNQIAQIESLGAENAAAIAIDPKSGEVRVMVGSVDWRNDQFGKVNMVNTARQPGSSFKPIYYAESLQEEVITAASIVEDRPTTFGGDYTPRNFDGTFRGDVTVRRSLANSLNIPAVKVMQELGVEESVEAAQRLGIEDIDGNPDQYGLALALGSAEVKLMDMTNAYAAFANQGMQYDLGIIQSVEDKYGKVVDQKSPSPSDVMGAEGSYLISSILADENARAEVFGSSLSIGRPAAAKTGTTDDNKDAWTIGYTPTLATGVWVGNNSNESMSAISGSSGAAPIWRTIMTEAHNGEPVQEFEMPNRVVSQLVCRSNGLPTDRSFSGSYTEYFIRGTVPEGRCEAPAPDRQPQQEPQTRKEEESEEQPELEHEEPEDAEPEPEDEEPESEDEEALDLPEEDGELEAE